MRKLLVMCLALVLGIGCAALPAAPSSAATNGGKIVKVKLQTSMGDITLELDGEKAPATVENFVQYVKDGFYDGVIFHRVIDGFMIQGGGFTPDMKQKPTRAPIKNEADNGLKNDVYTIAMARTPDPHSASAQFFINVKDNDFLNFSAPTPSGWGYAVFGKVIDGSDVVDAIAKVNTGNFGPFGDVPLEPVIITKAEVLE
ncbi:MAG TPA: peptidyl-prolyl cis-trans isomerase [Candidatus Mailhella merdavium]|nr:peptidyl-prolyl cis-trans isomerase [Candidatus Mailhella merdavium]